MIMVENIKVWKVNGKVCRTKAEAQIVELREKMIATLDEFCKDKNRHDAKNFSADEVVDFILNKSTAVQRQTITYHAIVREANKPPQEKKPRAPRPPKPPKDQLAANVDQVKVAVAA